MFLSCFGIQGSQSQGCVCSRLCVPGAPSGLCVCQALVLSTRFASCHQMDKVKTLFHWEVSHYLLAINFEHPFWRVPKICLIDVCDLFLSSFPPSTPFSFSVQPRPEVLCLITPVSWAKPPNGYSWFTSSLIKTDKHDFPCSFFSSSHTVVGTWDMWIRQKFSMLI